jgi:hypothetical protein
MDLRHSSLGLPTSAHRSWRSRDPVTRNTRRENGRSACAPQPQPFMTKLHPLLHASNRARACTSRRFSPSRGAKPVSFADKKWDPRGARKMQPQARQRLTAFREKTRPTKLKNPRAWRYLVRAIEPSPRQNSTLVVAHFRRHSGLQFGPLSILANPVILSKRENTAAIRKAKKTCPLRIFDNVYRQNRQTPVRLVNNFTAAP